jgi:hypothetical protein
MSDPFIVSSSSLGSYFTCKKQYQIGFEMMLEPQRGEGGVINVGLGFHSYAHWMTLMRQPKLAEKAKPEDLVEPAVSDEIKDIYRHWWNNIGVFKEQTKKIVLGAEAPIYTQIKIAPGITDQEVYLRCTFDEIYLDKEGWIVALDYKTFSKLDPWDVDLDFQGRLYTAALQLMFPSYPVRFEYQRIRQAAPGTPRGESQNLRLEDGIWWQYTPKGDKRKKAELWQPEECYETVDMVCAPNELVQLWKECEYAIGELLVRKRLAPENPGAWVREANKMTCKMCMYKELCKADLQGTLDEGTIEILATARKPFVTPDFLRQTVESENGEGNPSTITLPDAAG